MKIKTFYVVLLLFFFCFSSCEDSNDRIDEPENTSFTNKEIITSARSARMNNSVDLGQIHNTVLQNYYDNYGFQEDIPSINTLNHRLLDICKNNYPEFFNEASPEDLENFINFLYGDSNLENFSFRARGEIILSSAVEQNIISLNFKDFVNKLVDDNEDVNTTLSKINTFIESNDLTEKEVELLGDFKSVLTSSDVFWDKNYNVIATIANRGRCNPKHQVRLADAYGTILGGTFGSVWFPGVGSIIGGALGGQGFSAIIEHMQDQYGGGCVR